MKITRKQLRRIIREAIAADQDFVTVSDEEFAADSAAAYDRMSKGYTSDNPESIDAALARPAITDNVRLEVIDGNGEKVPVQIPYYIITDALEDGLTVDGLFNEVEDYVQGNYYLNAWDFTEQSEKEISAMHRGSSMSEGKCDKASGHEGCVRKRAKGWVVLSNKTGKPWRGGGEKDGDIVYYDSETAAKKALGAYHG